ncbi:hypothetical protein GE300_20870 [Rhodobacteraceae bacterium 2CG4]|uniref:Uncharacterized protein n=1 Tax=Halovulum marinum TaxID=2662447 RepID=A0A6L5Z605_9RHOB|nr:hypothetical protein [Halovulum marinum]MSU92011.1 hypothetical protein [Halovulum marinum]
MDWSQLKIADLDLLLAVCGYESRATFVAEEVYGNVTQTVILDYGARSGLAYDANRAKFDKMKNRIFLSLDGDYISRLQSIIQENAKLKPENERITVLFDVSCSSRRLMSKVLLSLDKTLRGRLDLKCTYAVSKYYEPPIDELPSHISEPVVGELSGWSNDLAQPPCAIIGLGFEPGRAIGCLDYLEIPEVRLFQPFGPDPRFIDAVETANQQLIEDAGHRHLLPYSIMEPIDTYLKLESMVYGLLDKFRPVLIPLGPKIFSATCIILAIRNAPQICVWRTSSGSLAQPLDIETDGNVAVFNVGAIHAKSIEPLSKA